MGKLAREFTLAVAGMVGTNAVAAQMPVGQNFRVAAEKKAAATGTSPEATNEQPGSSKFTARAAEAQNTPPVPKPEDVNAGSPNWQLIERQGEPLDYFKYWTLKPATTEAEARSPNFNNEILGSTVDTHHPDLTLGQEVNFTWQPSVPVGAETKFSGHVTVNQPDNHIYWFDPYTGKNLGKDPVNDPQYRYVLPSEFTIASQFYGVKGLTVQGGITGNAPGSPNESFAIAYMYNTDRKYSDGNNEYGFWKELASTDKNAKPEDQPMYFYYSTRTNCFEGWGCRSEDKFDSKPEEQHTYGPIVIKNVRNMDEGVAPNFYYGAYMVPDDNVDPDHKTGYKFRVQIVDGYHPDRLATCNINGGGDQPCAIDVPIENWFPAQQVQNGPTYTVVGTQTAISGNGVDRAPKFDTPDPKFNVKGVWQAR